MRHLTALLLASAFGLVALAPTASAYIPCAPAWVTYQGELILDIEDICDAGRVPGPFTYYDCDDARQRCEAYRCWGQGDGNSILWAVCQRVG